MIELMVVILGVSLMITVSALLSSSLAKSHEIKMWHLDNDLESKATEYDQTIADLNDRLSKAEHYIAQRSLSENSRGLL